MAIRISRPFASESEFLQHELDTLTRTTVVLLGAQSRPQGVVLRFEVALASGDVLMRGEGRVVGFRAASQGVDSGLTLRFTRLDARSKALVDRAAAMREARAKASLHPPRGAASVAPPPPAAAPAFAPEPPEPRGLDPHPQPSLAEPISSSQFLPTSEPSKPEPIRATPRSAAASGKIPQAKRDELLDRLRQRAKALSPAAIASLLASRARRA